MINKIRPAGVTTIHHEILPDNVAQPTLFSYLPDDSKKKSAGDSGSGKSAGAGTSFDNLYEQMLARFKPMLVEYEPVPEETLRAGIERWLRPGYDAAIEARQAQTETYHAELDADALSRGMGASSYVSDVKARQKDAEARDLRLLESDFTATLAKHLSNALENERARAFEAGKINSERENEAQRFAYNAAVNAYGSGQSASSSCGSGGKRSSYSDGLVTSAENCDAFIRGLTPEERGAVYGATTDQNRRYRDELVASLGVAGYLQLQQRYQWR